MVTKRNPISEELPRKASAVCVCSDVIDDAHHRQCPSASTGKSENYSQISGMKTPASSFAASSTAGTVSDRDPALHHVPILRTSDGLNTRQIPTWAVLLLTLAIFLNTIVNLMNVAPGLSKPSAADITTTAAAAESLQLATHSDGAKCTSPPITKSAKIHITETKTSFIGPMTMTRTSWMTSTQTVQVAASTATITTTAKATVTAVPWFPRPGDLFTIHDQKGRLLSDDYDMHRRMLDDVGKEFLSFFWPLARLTMAYPDSPSDFLALRKAADFGQIWECFQKDGWYGFRNKDTDNYLGHDGAYGMIAQAKRQNDSENLTLQPKGKGYEILTTHRSKLLAMKENREGILTRGEQGELVFEFRKVPK